jgi:hypothetical protein
MSGPSTRLRRAAAMGGVTSVAGGVAALLAASLLLVGIAALVLGLPGLELRTWLVVLFQINAGLGRLPADPLRVFNPLDVVLLVLTAAAILGIWQMLPRVSRAWLCLSVGLPFAGIALLLATHIAGRSSLMGAGFVVSLVMLRDRDLRRLGILGVVANALLFVGDLGTGDSTQPLGAVMVAVGYLLLLAWFALIGVRLLGSSRRVSTGRSACRLNQGRRRYGRLEMPKCVRRQDAGAAEL